MPTIHKFPDIVGGEHFYLPSTAPWTEVDPCWPNGDPGVIADDPDNVWVPGQEYDFNAGTARSFLFFLQFSTGESFSTEFLAINFSGFSAAWAISLTNTQRIKVDIYNTSGGFYQTVQTGTLTQNVPYWVLVTRTGTTLQVRVNTVLAATTSSVNGTARVPDAASILSLAGDSSGNQAVGAFWTTKVGKYTWIDRALTVDERTEIHELGGFGYPDQAYDTYLRQVMGSNLQHYWPMHRVHDGTFEDVGVVGDRPITVPVPADWTLVEGMWPQFNGNGVDPSATFSVPSVQGDGSAKFSLAAATPVRAFSFYLYRDTTQAADQILLAYGEMVSGSYVPHWEVRLTGTAHGFNPNKIQFNVWNSSGGFWVLIQQDAPAASTTNPFRWSGVRSSTGVEQRIEGTANLGSGSGTPRANTAGARLWIGGNGDGTELMKTCRMGRLTWGTYYPSSGEDFNLRDVME